MLEHTVPGFLLGKVFEYLRYLTFIYMWVKGGQWSALKVLTDQQLRKR